MLTMKQARLLTKTEIKRVLAVVDANRHAERNRAVFYLSFYSGLKACEIASLKLGDIVDGQRQVKSQFVLEQHQTKGNERQRIIVSTKLQNLLQQYVDTVYTNQSLNSAFIRSQKGNHFSPLTIVQLFARIYASAGIAGASSHSERRQFITTLAENQINIRVIQALARHRHLNTTSLYIDVNDKKLETAVESIQL